MSGSLNKVMLIGNLGRDPEIRTMNSGDKVASFSIATSETWRDRNTGERKERTEWHRISVFNDNLVKVVENYLHKGSKVFIEGALQTRKYTDQSGAERQATEIVLQKFRGELTMLDGRAEGGGAREDDSFGGGGYGGASSGGGGQRRPSSAPREDFSADLDDEIPF
jgi:single-strand DNA-binding protein